MSERSESELEKNYILVKEILFKDKDFVSFEGWM